MAIPGINFAIGADAAGLKRGIADATSAVQGFGGAIQAAAGMMAFSKIASAFGSVIAESSRAAAESRRFANTMQGVGTAADPQHLYDLAAALQNVTTFDDEATISAASMMARFKMSQGQIEAMLPSVQDLAAYMGKDLSSAADDVGRAVSVGAEGLRALHLGFTESERKAFGLASQSQRVAILMARMKEQVGGFAQVMASTASGAMTQLDNALGDLKEAFGGILDAPVAAALRAITSAVQGATTWFNGLSDGTKSLIAGFATGGATIAALVAALAGIAGAIGVLQPLLPALTTGFAAMGKAGLAGFTGILLPMAAVVAGLMGVVLIIGAMRRAWAGDLGGMRTAITNWVRDVRYLWAELVNALGDLWNKFTDSLPQVVKDKLGIGKVEGIDVSGDKFADQVQAALDTGAEGLKGVWDDLKGVFADGAGALGDVAKSLGIDFSSFAQHTEAAAKKTAGRPEGDMVAERVPVKWLTPSTNVTQDLFDEIIGRMHGDVDAAYLFAGAIGKMNISTDQFEKIFSAAGESLPAAMQMASDFASTAAVTGQATAQANAYWSTWAGKLQLAGAAALGGLQAIGTSLLNNAGPGGAIVGKMVTAGVTGNPMEMGSAIGDLMSQSESFQNAMAQVSEIMGKLAQAFNPLFDVLGPIIEIASNLADIVGGVLSQTFAALQPIFSILVELLRPIGTIIGSLAKVFGSMLGTVLNALMPFIRPLIPIFAAFGTIVEALAPLLGIVTWSLQPVTEILKLLEPVINFFFDAVMAVVRILMWVAKAIAGVWNGIIGGIAWVLEKIDEWIPGDVLKNFAGTMRRAMIDTSKFDVAIDQLNKPVDEATGAIGKIKPPAEEAAESISNLPQIIKVSRLRLEAAMPEGAAGEMAPTNTFASVVGMATQGMAQAFSQSSSSDNSKQVHIEKLEVNGGASASEAANALKTSLETDRYRMSGSTEASPYPAATPRTAAAY